MSFLTLTLLLPLTIAQSPLSPRQEGFINQTTDDGFLDWLKAANASAAYKNVMIPDITNQFPSSGSEIGYKAWLRIDDETDDTTEQVHAGLHPLEMFVNDNGTLEADDSWAACLSLGRFRDHGIARDAEINANCSNVFSTDCLDWLNEWAEDGRVCLNSTRPGYNPWEDSPCDGSLDGDVVNRPLVPDTVGPLTNLGNLSLYSMPANGDNDDDKTYDNFVDSIYLLAVGFAGWDASEGSSGAINETDETVDSIFMCMRANQFSEGSRTLEDIEDAGFGMRASLGWTVAAGAAVVVLTAGLL